MLRRHGKPDRVIVFAIIEAVTQKVGSSQSILEGPRLEMGVTKLIENKKTYLKI